MLHTYLAWPISLPGAIYTGSCLNYMYKNSHEITASAFPDKEIATSINNPKNHVSIDI
ncbi:hypothetical protein AA0112_g1475 [Alternaria arborescens]|nr:hypothetical protein AA0112_g1475 [Alternaria arborescens]